MLRNDGRAVYTALQALFLRLVYPIVLQTATLMLNVSRCLSSKILDQSKQVIAGKDKEGCSQRIQ